MNCMFLGHNGERRTECRKVQCCHIYRAATSSSGPNWWCWKYTLKKGSQSATNTRASESTESEITNLAVSAHRRALPDNHHTSGARDAVIKRVTVSTESHSSKCVVSLPDGVSDLQTSRICVFLSKDSDRSTEHIVTFPSRSSGKR